jgi:phage/plasmid primase-like uncharacterized protein
MTKLQRPIPDVNVIEQFMAAMRELDIDIDENIIADGKLHRYHVAGDRSRSKNAWAVLYVDDHPAGKFGCNKRYNGEKFSWTMRGAQPLSASERAELRQRSKMRAAQRRAETERLQAEAAKRAFELYAAGHPVETHPYLDFKEVQSHPKLRTGDWYRVDEATGERILMAKDALLVPLMDFRGQIHSLEAIFADDDGGYTKLFMKGGAKQGHFLSLAQPKDNIVLLCEGLATGLSLWQYTGHCVLIAFDAGNLVHVAREVRQYKVDARILICSDNDRWTDNNPGLHYAGEAARVVGGNVLSPDFFDTSSKPTDFNDLHQLEGEDAVRAVIERALATLIEAPETALADEAGHIDVMATTTSDLPAATPAALGNGDEAENLSIPDERPMPPVTIGDVLAYLPTHQYIFIKTRDLWPPSSVNAVIPHFPGSDGKSVKASAWLDQNQAVQQMTWAPGEPALIKDRLLVNGEWIESKGCACFNLYVPPMIISGHADSAGPWLEHVRRVYPAEADHIVRWLAHRVQKPGEKINHALVLGGAQGIGKDSILEPVIHAIGACNFSEVSPVQLQGRFNPFLKSIILRVSEARDLGEFDRYAFYEHMKTYTAAPPNVLLCDEKNLREHSVMNVCGVVMTTNHQSNGIFLPSDDRRHFVAWSPLTNEEFPDNYFRELYSWYNKGGNNHVAAYLASLDLSEFDAKAPPPKTAAFWAIVNANRSPEDAELADALDILDWPDAITLSDLSDNLLVDGGFRDWIREPRSRRQIPHRLETAGYVPVRNDAAKDHLWKIGTKRQVIYARKTLSERDRSEAANNLCAARRRT